MLSPDYSNLTYTPNPFNYGMAPTITPTLVGTPVATPATIPPVNRDNALAQARLGIQQELFRRGLDSNAYQADFDSYLSNIMGAVPAGQDISQFLTPNLASDVLGGVQNRQRNDFRGQVNNTFSQNSALDAVPDTFLDSTINDILSKQFGNAQSTLDRGRARGQYNEVGYQAGVGSLNNARQAAQTQLNTTEGDILSGYRSRIGDVRNNAYNQATGFTLGDTFNIDDFMRQRDSIVGEAGQNAAGELISAIGSTPLFDIGNIANMAGQAQGAVNLNNADVRESLAARRNRAAQGRGLGSQGAF